MRELEANISHCLLNLLLLQLAASHLIKWGHDLPLKHLTSLHTGETLMKHRQRTNQSLADRQTVSGCLSCCWSLCSCTVVQLSTTKTVKMMVARLAAVTLIITATSETGLSVWGSDLLSRENVHHTTITKQYYQKKLMRCTNLSAQIQLLHFSYDQLSAKSSRQREQVTY